LGDELVYDQGWKVQDARQIRREKIGFIFQAHYLIPFLNVLDNVALLPLTNSTDDEKVREKSKEIWLYVK
jgi:putative ABC transport system ATP-binding protein